MEGKNQNSLDFKVIKNLEKEIEQLNKAVYRKVNHQELNELKEHL